MKKSLVFIALLAIIVAIWGNRQNENLVQQPSVAPSFATSPLTIKTSKADHVFMVEMALTPEQQKHGLMQRKTLAADHGMLFVFKQDSNISMWMKNTPLSLDMFFIDNYGTIVHIAENTKPESTDIISANMPVHAVLETNAGVARKLNINVGDHIINNPYIP